MQLEFLVEEQTIYALPTNSIPRRGSKEYLSLLFRFPEAWEKYTKTVYFQYGDYSEPVLIGDSGVVDVPAYFTAQDSFLIMLVGIAGEEVCPTNVLCIALEASGDTLESVPPDTEMPAYQQIVALAQEAAASADAARIAAEAAENAKSAYDIAVKNGYSGTESEWLESLKGNKGDTGETTLPVARASSGDGIAYAATDAGSGCTLPTVSVADNMSQISAVGKGRQLVFIPWVKNQNDAPTLQLNGGEIIPIRIRAPKNQGTNDSVPTATLPVSAGALMRGVPYTMTFCGKYWLVDSAIGGGNAELVELTQPVTISDTECNNVQEALKAAADALVGKIDEVDVEEVPFVTASNAIQKVANDTAPITPAGVKRIVDEYGVNAQNIVEIVQTEIDRLCPEPIQLTMLPKKPAYYHRIIREFSAQKQYAKYDYCYRMPDNDTYTHFYYCKVASGHLGDWSDADFTDLGRIIDPTLDPALAAVNWTEYTSAAERGTLKLYANATIYNQARKYDANGREFIFNCPDQNANSWLNIKFDVDGALSGCEYQSFGFASAD